MQGLNTPITNRIFILFSVFSLVVANMFSMVGQASAHQNLSTESCDCGAEEDVSENVSIEEINAQSEGVQFLDPSEALSTLKGFENSIGGTENDYSKAVQWLKSKGFERIEDSAGTVGYDKLTVVSGTVNDVYESKVIFGHENGNSIGNIDVVYDKESNELIHVHAQYFSGIVEGTEEFTFSEAQSFISGYGYTDVHNDAESLENELNELRGEASANDLYTSNNSEYCGYATQAVCIYHCGVSWALACSAGGLKTAIICGLSCSTICGFGTSWLCNQI
ncbi:hypothetical protein ACTHP3_04700 [Shouchella rhizosphaerae]|uniref:hypothetical protein n=1 Tax=Shouchella rhizosphaerae TaxID=866786 RepID=UPI003F7EC352